jgi:transcriptional regulator with XRE-family HTH domain
MTPVYIRVEEIRKRKGVTKTHIARHCGRSISWYQDISKGRRNMSVDALQKIAEALEVPISSFFEDEVSETRSKRNA